MSAFDELPTMLSRHFHRCHMPVEMCNTCREADAVCTPEDLQAGYLERFGVPAGDGYGEPGWTPPWPVGVEPLAPAPPSPQKHRAAFRVVGSEAGHA